MVGDLSEMVRKLVEAAVQTCEPENVDEAATACTRTTLTRKFTEIITGHRPKRGFQGPRGIDPNTGAFDHGDEP